jgi:hypothetical protein
MDIDGQITALKKLVEEMAGARGKLTHGHRQHERFLKAHRRNMRAIRASMKAMRATVEQLKQILARANAIQS